MRVDSISRLFDHIRKLDYFISITCWSPLDSWLWYDVFCIAQQSRYLWKKNKNFHHQLTYEMVKRLNIFFFSVFRHQIYNWIKKMMVNRGVSNIKELIYWVESTKIDQVRFFKTKRSIRFENFKNWFCRFNFFYFCLIVIKIESNRYSKINI